MDDRHTAIWKDDLFDRQREASNVSAYIKDACAIEMRASEGRAFTMSIDAGYGEGKSFFVRRLAKELALEHPVAFVDAWVDDLADEPLTALAATLKEALLPLGGNAAVKDSLSQFIRRTSRVAKVVAWGLMRRSAAAIITVKGVDALDETLSSSTEVIRETAEDKLGDVAEAASDDAASAWRSAEALAPMESKIAAFEEGKRAIAEMKRGLSAVVASLSSSDLRPPIVIIVDELDRCRPTYAIKFLEQIKNLFDVPGLVFIFALNIEQLQHSVRAAYGFEFNGRAYLSRFIDRQYRLAQPQLTPWLHELCMSAGLDRHSWTMPALHRPDRGVYQGTLAEVLSSYMRIYDVPARECIKVIDCLRTCAALAEGEKLHVAYLVPLVVGFLKGRPPGSLPDRVHDIQVQFAWPGHGAAYSLVELDVSALGFERALSMGDDQRNRAFNKESPPVGVTEVYLQNQDGKSPDAIWKIRHYGSLVREIGRFSMPEVDAADQSVAGA